MLACVACSANENDFTEIVKILTRDGLELSKQALADDGHPGLTVIEDVFVIMRFRLCIHRHGDSANFDCAEKGIEEFGRVEQQEEHAVFLMDAKTPQGVAGAVGTLKQLLICDAMVGAFDSDVLGAAFEDVAIHEIRGDVEILRQRDHVGSRVTEKNPTTNVLASATA